MGVKRVFNKEMSARQAGVEIVPVVCPIGDEDQDQEEEYEQDSDQEQDYT